MAEQLQTNIVEGYTIANSNISNTTPIVDNQTIEPNKNTIEGYSIATTPTVAKPELKTIEGYSIATTPIVAKPELNNIEGYTLSSTLTTPQTLSTDNYSNFEKIRYGIDKQNTFFGNLYRVAKAGTQAAFDSDLEFKDYAIRNFNEEQRDLKIKYGNFFKTVINGCKRKNRSCC